MFNTDVHNSVCSGQNQLLRYEHWQMTSHLPLMSVRFLRYLQFSCRYRQSVAKEWLIVIPVSDIYSLILTSHESSSIDLFIFFCLTRVGLWWQQNKLQISLSPSLLFSSFLKIPGHSQARWDMLSLHEVLGLPLGLIPVGCDQKTSKERRPGGI